MATKAAAKPRVGFFHMLRDVFLASIVRGQFPLAIAGACVLLFLWRMPPDQLMPFAGRLLESLDEKRALGYGLLVVQTFAWFFHARWQRRVLHGEIERLAAERNDLQKMLQAGVRTSRGSGKVKR